MAKMIRVTVISYDEGDDSFLLRDPFGKSYIVDAETLAIAFDEFGEPADFIGMCQMVDELKLI